MHGVALLTCSETGPNSSFVVAAVFANFLLRTTILGVVTSMIALGNDIERLSTKSDHAGIESTVPPVLARTAFVPV